VELELSPDLLRARFQVPPQKPDRMLPKNNLAQSVDRSGPFDVGLLIQRVGSRFRNNLTSVGQDYCTHECIHFDNQTGRLAWNIAAVVYCRNGFWYDVTSRALATWTQPFTKNCRSVCTTSE
jgi:hypothetical protein